jgi:hypothetical protein
MVDDVPGPNNRRRRRSRAVDATDVARGGDGGRDLRRKPRTIFVEFPRDMWNYERGEITSWGVKTGIKSTPAASREFLAGQYPKIKTIRFHRDANA